MLMSQVVKEKPLEFCFLIQYLSTYGSILICVTYLYFMFFSLTRFDTHSNTYYIIPTHIASVLSFYRKWPYAITLYMMLFQNHLAFCTWGGLVCFFWSFHLMISGTLFTGFIHISSRWTYWRRSWCGNRCQICFVTGLGSCWLYGNFVHWWYIEWFQIFTLGNGKFKL